MGRVTLPVMTLCAIEGDKTRQVAEIWESRLYRLRKRTERSNGILITTQAAERESYAVLKDQERPARRQMVENPFVKLQAFGEFALIIEKI